MRYNRSLNTHGHIIWIGLAVIIGEFIVAHLWGII